MYNTKVLISAIALIFFSGGCLNESENPGPRKPQDEYTLETPGRWKAQVKTHVPTFKVIENRSENNLEVSVAGHDFNQGHYIEKIGVMDKNKKDVVSRSLPRGAAPRARFTIDMYNLDDYKIYVKCNMHDLWTAELHR